MMMMMMKEEKSIKTVNLQEIDNLSFSGKVYKVNMNINGFLIIYF